MNMRKVVLAGAVLLTLGGGMFYTYRISFALDSTPPTPSHPQSFFSQVGDELSAVQTLAAGSWGTLGSSFSLPA
ncbi:MAG: hypothetical protein ACYC8S_03470, partial [Minisyncoccota bacterium]